MTSIDLFHSAFCVPDSGDLSQNRFDHLTYALSKISISGQILEFGVHSGSTINYISSLYPDETIFGFDSFEGLPEDWNISYNEKFNKHKKGYFSLSSLPKVNKNVILIKGFFDASLEPWIKDSTLDQIKFLHIDSDLYSSAKYVLLTLNKFIVPGTIIVFDEFYPWGRKRYETWAEHEYKALEEWSSEYSREYEVIARNCHQQCSIRIVK